nr:OB-fold nucleic acid binding domain-containing protein [Mycoplasmopsis bovis]
MSEHTIKHVLEKPRQFKNLDVTLRGWVVSNRGNNKIRFLTISDGSTVENIQVTFKGDNFDFKLLDEIRTGACNWSLWHYCFNP